MTNENEGPQHEQVRMTIGDKVQTWRRGCWGLGIGMQLFCEQGEKDEFSKKTLNQAWQIWWQRCFLSFTSVVSSLCFKSLGYKSSLTQKHHSAKWKARINETRLVEGSLSRAVLILILLEMSQNTDWPDVAASGLVGRLPATEPSILMGSAYYDAAIPIGLECDPFDCALISPPMLWIVNSFPLIFYKAWICMLLRIKSLFCIWCHYQNNYNLWMS